MNILFKRNQTAGRIRRARFKLWGKLELDEEERALIDRYDFDQSVLIYSYQEHLIRNSAIAGILASVIMFFVVAAGFGRAVGGWAAFLSFIAASWFYFDWFRETIYVKDLMYGRYFRCKSIIDLARREAWLQQICSYLRQVMESAKHWDGEEVVGVETLEPEFAKRVMIRGMRWFDM